MNTYKSIPTYKSLDLILTLCRDWYIRKYKQSGIIKSFLLNWSTSYFKAKLIEGDNEYIIKDNIKYSVYYFNDQLIDYNQAKKIALSFRTTTINHNQLNVVLVKAIY